MSYQPNAAVSTPTLPYDPYMPQPSDHGLLAWTHPPILCQQTYTPTAGVGLYARVYVPNRITVANVVCAYSTAATVNSNTWFGIYDSGGTRRGVSADQSTPFQTVSPTGGLVVAISVDANQSLSVGPGFIYVGFLIGAATVKPVFRGASTSAGATSLGISAAPFMAGTIGSGLTALPTSITPSSMAVTSGPILLGIT